MLKSLVPTRSSQDKEKFSCPFQSTDNVPEWKLALMVKFGIPLVWNTSGASVALSSVQAPFTSEFVGEKSQSTL